MEVRREQATEGQEGDDVHVDNATENFEAGGEDWWESEV